MEKLSFQVSRQGERTQLAGLAHSVQMFASVLVHLALERGKLCPLLLFPHQSQWRHPLTPGKLVVSQLLIFSKQRSQRSQSLAIHSILSLTYIVGKVKTSRNTLPARPSQSKRSRRIRKKNRRKRSRNLILPAPKLE